MPRTAAAADIGARFGRYTVIGGPRSDPPKNHAGASTSRPRVRWLVRCDCGTERWVEPHSLRRGQAKSCGCLAKEVTSVRSGTHRQSGTVEYRTWRSMKDRCYRSRSPYFHIYGGRGIRVCARWRDSFLAFREDMGARPDGHSIDRVNNDGHYSCGKCDECIANGWPANCRWATAQQQAANTRQNNVLEFNGRRLCIRDWSREVGIAEETLRRRLSGGWSVEKALTLPASEGMRNRLTRTPSSNSASGVRHPGARLIEYAGKTQSISAWARELGFNPSTLIYRLKSGWTVGRALTAPIRGEEPDVT